MNDQNLALSLAYAIAPVLPGLHVYAYDQEVIPDGNGGFTHQRPDELQIPAVFVKSESQALAGSTSLSRAKVDIGFESQSDDDTSAEHAARVKAVGEVMGNWSALAAACEAAGGGITLCGRPCSVDSDPDTQKRSYITVLSFKIGYAD